MGRAGGGEVGGVGAGKGGERRKGGSGRSNHFQGGQDYEITIFCIFGYQ